MDFYQSLGSLVLGSRMRRVSEHFITEINKVYQHQGIAFEAGWFPLFYLLASAGQLSIRELSDTLSVSHSASSQLVSQLRKKGLVEISRSEDDGRKQLVSLTKDGKDMLARIEPLWAVISESMQDLMTENPATAPLLPAITALEQDFAKHPLSERIINHLNIVHEDNQ